MDISYRGLHATPVPQPSERLAVGVSCSLNWGPLRRRIGAFRQCAPEVELAIEDMDDERAGLEVDLAVALHDAGPRGWRSAPLWSEPLMVFMAEGHPLAGANAVEAADLADVRLLLAGAGAGDRALQRAIIRALGGAPSFLHYAVQRDNLLDLVSLGFGVTLAGGSTMGAFYPGVCVRPLESEAAWLSYCAFWRPERDRPALRRFLETDDA